MTVQAAMTTTNPGEREVGPTVFVVDDDEGVRKALFTLATSAGLTAETFASGTEFLAAFDPRRSGCLVLDVRIGNESGLDLQEGLAERNSTLPVIMITGYGNVPTSVRAMKSGAIDFLQKPFSPRLLLDRIREAIAMDEATRSENRRREKVESRVASLTPREKEVMGLLETGKTSKEIAEIIHLSVRTVEGHRREVLRKMGVGSAAQLVRLLLSTGNAQRDDDEAAL